MTKALKTKTRELHRKALDLRKAHQEAMMAHADWLHSDKARWEAYITLKLCAADSIKHKEFESKTETLRVESIKADQEWRIARAALNALT